MMCYFTAPSPFLLSPSHQDAAAGRRGAAAAGGQLRSPGGRGHIPRASPTPSHRPARGSRVGKGGCAAAAAAGRIWGIGFRVYSAASVRCDCRAGRVGVHHFDAKTVHSGGVNMCVVAATAGVHAQTARQAGTRPQPQVCVCVGGGGVLAVGHCRGKSGQALRHRCCTDCGPLGGST